MKTGAEHAMDVALNAGQRDAAEKWDIQANAYTKVLSLLGDPEITPTKWQRLLCRIFHQRHSLNCPNCGGTY